jgi:hypothetical protein
MSWSIDVMSVGEVNDRRLTFGHESEYEIAQVLWSSCPAKGVTNPARIR